VLVKSNYRPVDNAQLRGIAEWLDCASRWLEEEVRDNRERDLVEGTANPEQEVEVLAFLRPELDRMVAGLRRTADMLVAMTRPFNNSRMSAAPVTADLRSRAHLRLVQ
jgi:hypothetical protein